MASYHVRLLRIADGGAISGVLLDFQTDGGVYDEAIVDAPGGPAHWTYAWEVTALGGDTGYPILANARITTLVAKR